MALSLSPTSEKKRPIFRRRKLGNIHKEQKLKVECKKPLTTLFEPLGQTRPETWNFVHFSVTWVFNFPFWISSFKLNFCHFHPKIKRPSTEAYVEVAGSSRKTRRPKITGPTHSKMNGGPLHCQRDRDAETLGAATRANREKTTFPTVASMWLWSSHRLP